MELKSYFAQNSSGNVIPGAVATLYLTGTMTLATGLQTKTGAPLSNPFMADSVGLIQFAAPDGVYDLSITSGLLSYTLTVQCLDVTDNLAAAADLVDDVDTAASAAILSINNAASAAELAVQTASDAAVLAAENASDASILASQNAALATAQDVIDAQAARDAALAAQAAAETAAEVVTLVELNSLSDVDTTTVPPTDGQALVYDLATDKWIPGDVAAGGGGGSFTYQGEYPKINDTTDFESETIPPEYTFTDTTGVVVADADAPRTKALTFNSTVQNGSVFFEYNVTFGAPTLTNVRYHVESEEGYDFFRIYLNDVQILEDSGIQPWKTFTYTIPAGTHTLKFEYYRDSSVSEGFDNVRIGFISFEVYDESAVYVPGDLVKFEKAYWLKTTSTNTLPSPGSPNWITLGTDLDIGSAVAGDYLKYDGTNFVPARLPEFANFKNGFTYTYSNTDVDTDTVPSSVSTLLSRLTPRYALSGDIKGWDAVRDHSDPFFGTTRVLKSGPINSINNPRILKIVVDNVAANTPLTLRYKLSNGGVGSLKFYVGRRENDFLVQTITADSGGTYQSFVYTPTTTTAVTIYVEYNRDPLTTPGGDDAFYYSGISYTYGTYTHQINEIVKFDNEYWRVVDDSTFNVLPSITEERRFERLAGQGLVNRYRGQWAPANNGSEGPVVKTFDIGFDGLTFYLDDAYDTVAVPDTVSGTTNSLRIGNGTSAGAKRSVKFAIPQLEGYGGAVLRFALNGTMKIYVNGYTVTDITRSTPDTYESILIGGTAPYNSIDVIVEYENTGGDLGSARRLLLSSISYIEQPRTYVAGDLVEHDGSIWVCMQNRITSNSDLLRPGAQIDSATPPWVKLTQRTPVFKTFTTSPSTLTKANGIYVITRATETQLTGTLPDVGSSITIVQGGAGQILIDAPTLVTLVHPSDKLPKTRTQWSEIKITKLDQNTVLVSGDLAPNV